MTNKTPENNNIIQTYDYVINKVFEKYCDLKVSGTNLAELNMKGKHLFNPELKNGRTYNDIEILKQIKEYVKELSDSLGINYSDFMSYFKTQNINFSRMFNNLLSQYFSTKTKILTHEILSGNIQMISEAIDKIHQEEKQRDLRSQNNAESLNKLEKKRTELKMSLGKGSKKRDDIESDLIFNEGKKAKLNRKVIDDIKYMLLLNVTDILVKDENFKIKGPDDLNQYYDHSSGLENDDETRSQIYSLYLESRSLYKKHGITLKTEFFIFKLGKSKKSEGWKFSNNLEIIDTIVKELPYLQGKTNNHIINEFKKGYYEK